MCWPILQERLYSQRNIFWIFIKYFFLIEIDSRVATEWYDNMNIFET